jgi:hypothetical protein
MAGSSSPDGDGQVAFGSTWPLKTGIAASRSYRRSGALDFLAQHFQFQPFFLEHGMLRSLFVQLGGSLVERGRVLRKQCRIGQFFLQRGNGTGEFLDLPGQRLERVFLLVGELRLAGLRFRWLRRCRPLSERGLFLSWSFAVRAASPRWASMSE